MPTRRRPKLAAIHGWIGAILALPLLVMALSGAALLYRDALFVPSDWRAVQPQSDAEITRLLAHPALQNVDGIRPARGVRGFHVVTARDESQSWWRIGESAPVDPAAVPVRLRVEPTVVALHEYLLAGEAGDLFIRTIGPAIVVLMIVGLVLWWPLRRGWRARDLLPRAAGRPQLLRAHLALGGALGVLFLLQATTGTLVAHNTMVRATLRPYTNPQALALPGGAIERFTPADASAAIAAVRSIFPEGEFYDLRPTPETETSAAPGVPPPRGRWTMRLRLPGEAHPNGRSSVTLILGEGRVVSIFDARRGGAPTTYDDLLYPLHIGQLFGSGQRLLFLLGGLGLAALLLAGFVSFLRHRLSAVRPRSVAEAPQP